MEYAADPAAYLAALQKLVPAEPSPVVEIPLVPEIPCDGSYECQCRTCVADRRKRVVQHRQEARQPWQPIRRAA